MSFAFNCVTDFTPCGFLEYMTNCLVYALIISRNQKREAGKGTTVYSCYNVSSLAWAEGREKETQQPESLTCPYLHGVIIAV